MNRSNSGWKVSVLACTGENSTIKARRLFPVVMQVCAVVLFAASMFAQETTGGLQGSVKDPSGAVVSQAHVVVIGTSLTGEKTVDTDKSGYYRFANLPPGSYTVTITAKGFRTIKREGLIIEVGHLPTIDFGLEVGGNETVVEVSGAAPSIDVTTETTQTNITSDVIQDVPHGRSFQSVIQFAPSARNEPLMGNDTTANGTGGTSPGNGTNGSDHGFSVAGGSDSENSYLVEGQETANLIGGYSHTNVPFDFIQEVQVKSSGVEAEHGGSLGGVVNVVMKKGSNGYHGSVFTQFENGAMDGSPVEYSRYDPNGAITRTPPNGYFDAATQLYQPIRPKTSDVFPGFTLGGPILKDRIFGFVGFSPEWVNEERKVNFGPGNGVLPFSRNTQTYYTTARIDASITSKIRVFGSWLYQYQRQSGEALPHADSTNPYNFTAGTGFFNASSGNPTFAYAHSLGYSAPNITTNVGADFTITPHLVATTRFGYYFENYHDFGYPTTGDLYLFQNSGTVGSGATDTNGNPLPASLQQSFGYFNVAQSQNYTLLNANKAIQYDADLAWFKSGWKGTHNFKFGYQLNRLSNNLSQRFNEPAVYVYPGFQPGTTDYTALSATGIANCQPFINLYGVCQGQYGTVGVQDFGSKGKATSFNHGLFVQVAWTIGHGITINAGVRFDKEYLPAEDQPGGQVVKPINFSWTDKVAPRIGAAWDVFKDGRMKVFGSYGAFYDIMKLNLAISSFGGQYWNICTYALDNPNLLAVNPAFDSTGRYCQGALPTGTANFPGAAPGGLTFLENVNNRTFPTTCSTCSATAEGVAPGLKPYKQHESVFGVDYQLSKTLSFEARWDRRRLDHVIEDSSILNQATGAETFVIVNPGQGVNRTFLGFCDFIYGAGASSACTSTTGYPPNTIIPGARSYDGVEFRLNRSSSDHWFGMFSYTYSKLRGNYSGLTSSDVSDGGAGGRNSPNNSRAFDEPYFSFNSQGGSSSGLLPTDRPSTFKGYAYYEMPWTRLSHKASTDFGIFQYLYQGSPVTTYADVGAGGGAWNVQVVDRGKWVDIAQDPTTGAFTIGAPRTYRTPWYTQSDFNLTQNYKISEGKDISFSAIVSNLLNQRAVTAYNEQVDTNFGSQYITPPGPCIAPFTNVCYVGNGVPFYTAAENPYSLANGWNNYKNRGYALALNSSYGKPQYFQAPRSMRLQVKFTF